MNHNFKQLLENPSIFRYGFLVIILFCVLLNKFTPGGNFFILFILCSIFLGIGFYNQPLWVIVTLNFLVVILRLYLIPEPISNAITFVTFFLTYLLVTIISVGLMRYAQRVKQDNIELTQALANALDSRDKYTMNHSRNVAIYSKRIAEKMGVPKGIVEDIYIGSLLHDIGKIGIPESILNKPGKLTNDEFNTIMSHTTIGYGMIKHIDSFNNNCVLDIVLHHHERYDGQGYPSGLKGEDIPISARIVAVADTFDAMSSNRVYRDKRSIYDILTELQKNKGTQFDPQIVEHLIQVVEENKDFPPSF